MCIYVQFTVVHLESSINFSPVIDTLKLHCELNSTKIYQQNHRGLFGRNSTKQVILEGYSEFGISLYTQLNIALMMAWPVYRPNVCTFRVWKIIFQRAFLKYMNSAFRLYNTTTSDAQPN